MLELIFIKLLEISIQASFFILAVVLIRFCFKRLPKRYVCFLWALVAVRLILPFEINSTFSLVPDTSRVVSWADVSLPEFSLPENESVDTPLSQDHMMQEADNLENTPHVENLPGTSNLTTDLLLPGVNMSQSNLPQDDTASDSSISPLFGTNDTGNDTNAAALSLSGLLSRIWFLGMLAFLTYDLTSYLRLKYRLRAAIHEQDNIWYSDCVPAPFVLGYIKPRIYIPFSIRKEQLPYIIAHEQAHISHLDHLTKLLAALLVCVYWFNPFIWIAYLLYCKDLELACDERVIANLGEEEKKPYSEALLICSVTNKALLQSPLSFSEVAIKDRIVNILHYKKPGFWGVVLAVVVCAVTGVCFLTNPSTGKETQVDAKTAEFIEQTTIEILDQVTMKYHVEDDFSELPEILSKDSFYRITTTGTDGLQLYGLINGEAMILRDGDTLYPLYDIQWPVYSSEIPGNTPDIKIYKLDYDADGAEEYGVYQDKYDENGTKFGGMTILEIENGSLRAVPFTLSDMQEQLERISFEYADKEEKVYIYIDSKEQEVLDVAWVNKMYEQDSTRLDSRTSPYIRTSDLQPELSRINTAFSFVPPEGEEKSFVAVSFVAPVTYSAEGKFLIGDITIENLLNAPNLLTQYSTQLDDYPGEVRHSGHNEFTVTVDTQDYGCLVATDPNTHKSVYVWPDDYIQENVDRYWPPLNNATQSKDYPLELVDDKVQEVPAQVLTEELLKTHAFAEDVLEITYKLHPYGIKQYILRENGTLHVNIGYEAPEHVVFEYLTFEISEDGETAALEDYGTGYYLLYLNNVEALEAFRDTYTGEGLALPSKTSQLPWDWLLALNGEENDAPRLKESELPVVQQNHQFASFPSYNLNDRFNGFSVSERVVNGEVFTEFRYQDGTDDIRILTGTNNYEVISINYNGEDKPLPDQHLDIFTGGAAGSYGTVYYVDVTGDTQKELIFESGGGGTGAWINYCYVYNPETMEQYPIDLDVYQMTSKLYFNYTPDEETHYVYYNPETNCFEATVWIPINHAVPMSYVGDLNVQYVWDAATGKFVIDLDTVKLITSNGNAAVADTSSVTDPEKSTTITEGAYLDTSWYYIRTAQFLKDIDWENFSTRITEDENRTLQQFMPILNDEEFVWIYRLADNTHAQKRTTIRELLADQYDINGVDQVEPNIYTFCFADLFQTGNNDLILCLCNLPDWEWLIFHEEDGVVYCIDMSIRAFSYPQTNGIYTASNGADDTVYYRLTFADGDIINEQIGRVVGDELYIDGKKQSASTYETWKNQNLTLEYYPYYHPIEEVPATD